MAHTVIKRPRAMDMHPPEHQKGSAITLHAHGDGTYHTTPDHWSEQGRVEHPTIGHALMHIAKEHSAGDHFHVHSHDAGYTTHHAMEGAKEVGGPHEHKTIGSVKKKLGEVLLDSKDDDDDGPG